MALSFEDLLNFGDLTSPFSNSLVGVDDFISDVIQGQETSCPKQSPSHESDSGMSEDFESLGSPESVSEDSGKMLDDLVDSMELRPFCSGGADQDLADYFGSYGEVENNHTEMSKKVLNTRSRSAHMKNGKGEKMLVMQKAKECTLVPSSPCPQTVAVKNKNDETSAVTSSGIQSVKVVKVIKTSGTSVHTAAQVIKAIEEKNLKNAKQAKMNREKKKNYIRGLEDEMEVLKQENGQLKRRNEQMVSSAKAMEEEILYLRSVLANESSLSKLLKNIENVKDVKLSSSFSPRKRGADMDHDYVQPSKKVCSENSGQTAGICLHVDKESVSLEFCSKCSRMAKSSEEK